jgi:hypothetical protein
VISDRKHIAWSDGTTHHVRDGRGVFEAIIAGGDFSDEQRAELERQLAHGEIRWHEVPGAAAFRKDRPPYSNFRGSEIQVILRTAAGPGAHWAEMVDDEGDWLRHHPTQVVIRKEGRSDAETLAHLADVLASHRMITEAERAACQVPEGPAPSEP